MYLVALVFAGCLSCYFYRSLGPGMPLLDSPQGNPAASLAESLREVGKYQDAYGGAGTTGPSAAQPPLFPVFLAITSPVAEWLGLLAFGLHGVLLVLTSKTLFSSERAGWIAAALTILTPVYRIPFWTDSIYSADLVMAAIVLTCWLTRHYAGWFPTSVVTGILAGLLLLENPFAGAIFVSFAVWQQLSRVQSLPVFGLLTLITLMPWTIRNAIALHGFVPLRDDLGLTLSTALRNCATPDLYQEMRTGCHQWHSPAFNPAENRKLAALGELGYNKLQLDEAANWVRTHPRKALDLTLQRIVNFWFPPHQPAAWMLVLLGWGGFAWMASRKHEWLGPITVTLAFYPLLFYFSASDPSQTYPMLWLMGLCAGLLLNEVLPTRLAIGSVVANGWPGNMGRYANRANNPIESLSIARSSVTEASEELAPHQRGERGRS